MSGDNTAATQSEITRAALQFDIHAQRLNRAAEGHEAMGLLEEARAHASLVQAAQIIVNGVVDGMEREHRRGVMTRDETHALCVTVLDMLPQFMRELGAFETGCKWEGKYKLWHNDEDESVLVKFILRATGGAIRKSPDIVCRVSADGLLSTCHKQNYKPRRTICDLFQTPARYWSRMLCRAIARNARRGRRAFDLWTALDDCLQSDPYAAHHVRMYVPRDAIRQMGQVTAIELFLHEAMLSFLKTHPPYCEPEWLVYDTTYTHVQSKPLAVRLSASQISRLRSRAQSPYAARVKRLRDGLFKTAIPQKTPRSDAVPLEPRWIGTLRVVHRPTNKAVGRVTIPVSYGGYYLCPDGTEWHERVEVPGSLARWIAAHRMHPPASSSRTESPSPTPTPPDAQSVAESTSLFSCDTLDLPSPLAVDHLEFSDSLLPLLPLNPLFA